jgi:hypothetical protein
MTVPISNRCVEPAGEPGDRATERLSVQVTDIVDELPTVSVVVCFQLHLKRA